MAAGTTGTRLADRYRVVRRLGTGGMASVFLAEDERLGRKVAIKRLHAESADNMARRFMREAKVGASLNHPNIVAVYDTVTDDEGVLIVMEYVEGETLRDAIARGPMEAGAAMKVLRGVAAALDHAHEHGVVHRDVKPANILMGPDGRAKLADLGIASAAERTRITHSGTVLGTAAYMAPERLDGGAGGPAADVYSLAAVAFEALSGKKAIAGATPVEIARRIVSQPPPDLAAAWPEAPPAAPAALERGLAKEPGERPPSAGALVDDLGRALAPVLEPPTRPTTPLAGAAAPPRTAVPVTRPPARPPWRVPALALGALLLAVLLIVLLSSGGGSGTKKSASTPPKSRPAPAHHKSKASTPAAVPAGDPAATLSDFYTSSVGGNVDHAWSISTDRLHTEVQGRASLQHAEADLKAIHFTMLNTTQKTASGATVVFADDAQHATYTDHCNGSAQLVPGGSGGWMLDYVSVQCRQGGQQPAAPAPGPPGKAKGHDKGPKPGKGNGQDGGD